MTASGPSPSSRHTTSPDCDQPQPQPMPQPIPQPSELQWQLQRVSSCFCGTCAIVHEHGHRTSEEIYSLGIKKSKESVVTVIIEDDKGYCEAAEAQQKWQWLNQLWS